MCLSRTSLEGGHDQRSAVTKQLVRAQKQSGLDNATVSFRGAGSVGRIGAGFNSRTTVYNNLARRKGDNVAGTVLKRRISDGPEPSRRSKSGHIRGRNGENVVETGDI